MFEKAPSQAEPYEWLSRGPKFRDKCRLWNLTHLAALRSGLVVDRKVCYYNDSLFLLVSWHCLGYPGLFHPNERKYTVHKGQLARGGNKTVTLGSLEAKNSAPRSP